ncbi:nicotinamidase/pyrazinamidase [Corynebacterium ciconiae DSM 44920]|uniref:isochorismatase family protein n=1 Tax=Corynebacterium ciconiae TaxID=227319 RepID=UPI0003606068|nr:isochorismatase family protein [Corynebacterium ciconiae]WKD60838.1 nicotinamidase/pyrazinamidase [Corynebacterium ciconiae DSM 44920]
MTTLTSEALHTAGISAEPYSAPAQRSAFVLVDGQYDFVEGGALGVEGGTRALAGVAEFLAAHAANYAVCAVTRDWHIDPGAHFSEQPDFAESWPRHCVAGTTGAELHPQALRALDNAAAAHPGQIRIDVTKGEYSAAYSGFEGATAGGTSLADALRGHEVASIDVAGIATDYCVRATCLDGLAAGFEVRLLVPLSAGVAEPSSVEALAEIRRRGVHLLVV